LAELNVGELVWEQLSPMLALIAAGTRIDLFVAT
jgi:hypothetical protein